MTLTTRKPTGLPSWPILLIAGVPKAGKSYACAAASASPLVGRTLWVPVGEDDPDELGGIPGADFDIVQHDGTCHADDWDGYRSDYTDPFGCPCDFPLPYLAGRGNPDYCYCGPELSAPDA